MHQIDVRYTELLVREAVNAFFWRTLRRRFGWSGAVALVVTLIAFGVLVLGGDRSWVVGFSGAAILFVLLIFLFGCNAHYRNATGRLKRMARPEARFVFTEQDFSITSDLGSGSLSWSSVREVWGIPAVLAVPAVEIAVPYAVHRGRRRGCAGVDTQQGRRVVAN
jgi:hypothetical protein